jgi:ADP-dependent NAD(P)H-hydrate dehydratase / NAD(P)H-hydrate epimerase
MVKLFSVNEMQALEAEANTHGLTYEMMMENAGKGLAKEIEIAYSHVNNKKIVSLVGSGNNGGDALVALTQLCKNNWKAYAYIIKTRKKDDPLVDQFIKSGGQVLYTVNDSGYEGLKKLLTDCSILIDGVLGTGIKLPLHGEVAEILKFVKKLVETMPSAPKVVAVDCPSGVDCDTGETAEETIPADLTVTMAGMKMGLIRFPAANLTGQVHVASIGPIEELKTHKNNKKIVLDKKHIINILPERSLDSHKGTYGTALIIAGSVNYTGAGLLAGMAAYRSGVGLVTTAIPAPLHDALAGQFPESTWILLPHEMGVISSDAARVVKKNMERATAVLIGPGFSLEDTTREFIHKLFIKPEATIPGDIGFIHEMKSEPTGVQFTKPVVLDADGLKLISKIPEWHKLLPSPAILTPHPGEMSIITGLSVEDIQANRIEIAAEYSKKWEHVVVLKGAFTVISAPDGQIAIVPVATPALAEAGTGDVLAGIIVGLRAQGVDAFNSACAGAWIHAMAGVLAEKRIGNNISVIAGDVLNAIPDVITDLRPLLVLNKNNGTH